MTPKVIAAVAGSFAAAAIYVGGELRSGGAHAAKAPEAPAQSTVSAPALTSADIAALRADFREANLAGRLDALAKRVDETSDRHARELAQVRTELRSEIRDSRRAADARADVIARDVRHFEQRFDAALSKKNDDEQ